METRYRNYSHYLKQRYGKKVYRVAVDAGFSCPNRGVDRSRPGCAYCDEYGSRAPYQEKVWRESCGATDGESAADVGGSNMARRRDFIRRQVERGIGFLRSRYGAEVLLLYFQAFSGTYAPVTVLRAIYSYGLSLGPFRELIVSTRPDCIDEEKADLLAGYMSSQREVWVELGLQSACDETLERISRGHTYSHFVSAFRILKDRGVKVAVHLIFGLPEEGLDAILYTVRQVSALGLDGIKIHNLHIPRDTALLEEYKLGDLIVPSGPRHLDYVLRSLELLPPTTVVMRMTCDTPLERLALPKRFWDKAMFTRELRAEMARRQTYQGRLWQPAVS
jgi:radical SAM protein (TIGR01212 family)